MKYLLLIISFLALMSFRTTNWMSSLIDYQGIPDNSILLKGVDGQLEFLEKDTLVKEHYNLTNRIGVQKEFDVIYNATSSEQILDVSHIGFSDKPVCTCNAINRLKPTLNQPIITIDPFSKDSIKVILTETNNVAPVIGEIYQVVKLLIGVDITNTEVHLICKR